MNRYRVTEQQMQWVTHLYDIEASSPDAAIKIAREKGDAYDVDYGDYVDQPTFQADLIEWGEEERQERLVDSAADLLEALEELVSRCDRDEGVRENGSNIDTSRAHAAISKAKGESDSCPECARSFGPHYQGECKH